jgi:hypothetical protein
MQVKYIFTENRKILLDNYFTMKKKKKAKQ